jgi:cell division protein FtsB
MNKPVRKDKKRWHLKSLLLIGVGGYLLFSFGHLGYGIYQANRQIEAYEAQKQALIAEREHYQKQIEQLHQASYIERLAREELGLVKPGETVIIPAVPGQVRAYIPLQPGDRFAD